MRARLVRLLGDDKGIEEIITYNRVMKAQNPAFNSTRFKNENPELMSHISRKVRSRSLFLFCHTEHTILIISFNLRYQSVEFNNCRP